MALTNHEKSALLSHTCGNIAHNNVLNVSFGLCRSLLFNDASNMANVEVSAPSYARVDVTNDTNTWGYDVNGAVYNKISIEWPTPTENWGLVSHFFIATTGLLYSTDGVVVVGSLLNRRPIVANDTVRIVKQGLSITIG